MLAIARSADACTSSIGIFIMLAIARSADASSTVGIEYRARSLELSVSQFAAFRKSSSSRLFLAASSSANAFSDSALPRSVALAMNSSDLQMQRVWPVSDWNSRSNSGRGPMVSPSMISHQSFFASSVTKTIPFLRHFAFSIISLQTTKSPYRSGSGFFSS